MIQRPLDQIGLEDIKSLVENMVREARTIEYKLSLPGGTDEDKREFLADVSSFANASGGDIVFGVEAKDGIPVATPGLVGFVEDKERLRLESIVRDGLDPRVPGVQLKAVLGASTRPVLVLRIPKSWSSPHMVTFKNLSRFYTRSSAGKFQLDVTEIRSAFALSEQLPERIRRWRDDRIAKIIADETPLPVEPEPKLVLHLIPIASLSNEGWLAAQALQSHHTKLHPIGVGGWDNRINIDGLVTFSAIREDAPKRSYCQVFRSGRVEAVTARIVTIHDDKPIIASIWYEREIIIATRDYLASMASLGVQAPIVATATIIGAKGAYMATDFRFGGFDNYPIDRNLILLPDVILEEYTADVPRALRPIFDAVWNAAGFPRSLNYDENGEWNPRS